MLIYQYRVDFDLIFKPPDFNFVLYVCTYKTEG